MATTKTATTDVLELLHERVVPDGFVVIDELTACKATVDALRLRHGIRSPLDNENTVTGGSKPEESRTAVQGNLRVPTSAF